jgi:hypothetical protein
VTDLCTGTRRDLLAHWLVELGQPAGPLLYEPFSYGPLRKASERVFGLDAVLQNQHKNGAWSQVFDGAHIRDDEPKSASYPDEWPRKHPGGDYWWHYTFNDGAMAAVIETLLKAERLYNEAKGSKAFETAGLQGVLTLITEPGTKYLYSNAGINTVGRIVEVVSGIPFERFIDERLLHPLRMVDTTFWPTSAHTSPAPTARSTPASATVGPNALRTPRMTKRGGDAGSVIGSS